MDFDKKFPYILTFKRFRYLKVNVTVVGNRFFLWERADHSHLEMETDVKAGNRFLFTSTSYFMTSFGQSF